MPALHWGAETQANREANVTELEEVYQQLDATIRPILDGFMQANDLQRQYTVSTSSTRLVWWLANPHTGWAESPLRIQFEVDPYDRAAEPVLAVDVQGAAEWVPQNVHTLGHILHRDTTYRVRLRGSQGNTAVWPQGTTHGLHERHRADVI
jgi:hypothetical protein